MPMFVYSQPNATQPSTTAPSTMRYQPKGAKLCFFTKSIRNLIETIESEDCTPSLSQAQRMHKLSDEKKLTMDVIFEIMQEQKANQKEYVKIPVETFKKYFKKDMPPKKMEEITEKALARYAVFLQKQRQWER